MGVTTQVNDSSCLVTNENCIVLIEDHFEEKPKVDDNLNKSKSPKKYKKVENSFKGDRSIRKKKLGVRSNRRSENNSFLLSLVEGEESSEGLGSFMEIKEQTINAFDELFMAQEKMKVWNDFINQPEDEQERLLSGEWVPLTVMLTDKADEEDMEKEFEIIDKREVHPAFSAEECFQRVDTGFRAFLKRKQVPWGSLKHLEAQVVPFFVEWPASVYVTELSCPVDRLLLHALCQYLDLCSHSFNGDDGKRHTQVENRNSTFASPLIHLSKYLNH